MCASINSSITTHVDASLPVVRSHAKVMLPNDVIVLIADYCIFVPAESDSKRGVESRSSNAYKLLIEDHSFSSPLEREQAFERENTYHQMRILRGLIAVKLAPETGVIKTRMDSTFALFKKSIAKLTSYPLHKMIDLCHTGEVIAAAGRLNPTGIYEERPLEAGSYNPISRAIEKNHLSALINFIYLAPTPAKQKESATMFLKSYISHHSTCKTLHAMDPIQMFVENGADPNKADVLHTLLKTHSPLFAQCLSLPGIDVNAKNSVGHRPLDQLFLRINEIENAELAYRKEKEFAFQLLDAGVDICMTTQMHSKVWFREALVERAFHLRTSQKNKVIFFAIEHKLSSKCIVKLIMQCPEMCRSLLGGTRTRSFDTYLTGYLYQNKKEITDAVISRMEMTSAETWERALDSGEMSLPD